MPAAQTQIADFRRLTDEIFTDDHGALALLARRDAPIAAPTDAVQAPPAPEPLVISGTAGPGMQATVTVPGDPAWAAGRLAAALFPTAVYLQAAALSDGTPVYPTGPPTAAAAGSWHRLVLILRPRGGSGRVDGATAANVLARLRREVEQLRAA